MRHSVSMRWPDEIRGDGVWLRRWRATDAPAVEAVRDDPFVARWSNMAAEHTHEWIARQHDRADGVSLAITVDPDAPAVGKVALGHLDQSAATAELSYWLVPAVRRRRRATAACRGLCDWALSEGGLRRILLEIDDDNPASESVARALGASRAAELDHTEVDRAGVTRQLRVWTLPNRVGSALLPSGI